MNTNVVRLDWKYWSESSPTVTTMTYRLSVISACLFISLALSLLTLGSTDMGSRSSVVDKSFYFLLGKASQTINVAII